MTAMRRVVVAVCLILAALCASNASAAPEPDAAALFETHCFDCHGYGAAEGNLALDELMAASPSAETREQWRKVWKMVRQEFMPPAGSDAPASGDRRAMTRWVEQSALGVDYDHPDPGRVTMRRLNRMEYEYTVTDLFGVDLTAARAFSSDASSAVETRLRDLLPPDDTAYGFDNIGDFQTLSPALLEKYFDIAGSVVSRVIVTDGPWYPSQRLDRSDMDVDGDDEAKRTEHTLKFEVAEAGPYRIDIQFSLGGWQEYGGGFEFRWGVDGEEYEQSALEVGGQKLERFTQEGWLNEGEHVLRLTTVAVKPDSEGELQRLTLNPRLEVTGPVTPDSASYPESHQRIFFDGEPPAEAAARREYAEAILERVASRAFRRPAPAETIDSLADLALADDDFERGIGQALAAILTSPRFLFRMELQPQPDDPQSVHALDDYALASRLSYLLWLSLPDEELTQLAAVGKLRDELPAQMRRMLADSKSDRFFEDFAGQWLRTRNVLLTAISRREEDIDPVRDAMKRETEMLFEHIAREDRDLLELITADYTFVDEELAEYYGIDGVDGDEFRRVDLPRASGRGGILTHGSFLVSTSNPDRTSPVKRGLFVLENLLATQPPAPPANVPPLEAAEVAGKRRPTVREQLEAHRADESCAACHVHFDPIGVALENYDVIGQWRDEDNNSPIDPTAITATGDELSGVDELRDYIAANEERYYRCVTEKLLTYALGRGLEPFDTPTVDRITDQLMAEGGEFSTLLTGVIESPAFLSRRGDDNELRIAPRVEIPEIPPPDQRRPERRRRRFRDRDRDDDRDRPRAEAEDREPEADPNDSEASDE
jgi:hypothetical protein